MAHRQQNQDAEDDDQHEFTMDRIELKRTRLAAEEGLREEEDEQDSNERVRQSQQVIEENEVDAKLKYFTIFEYRF